jgi:hypothetical protein
MHTLPQLPQLLRSVRGTQVLPQRMKPVPHWQTELLQVPVPQELPHAPQFAGSLMVLVHNPLQVWKPVGHAVWQAPFTQVLPAPHCTPQPPQLLGSLPVVTQTPLHEV